MGRFKRSTVGGYSYRLFAGALGQSDEEECYNGILTMVNLLGEKLGIKGVCIATGVGDINYYFERETVEDDLHGMGAFILTCSEIAKSKNWEEL